MNQNETFGTWTKISLSRRVMFFLLYRQNDIDKLTREIMENKPLGFRM